MICEDPERWFPDVQADGDDALSVRSFDDHEQCCGDNVVHIPIRVKQTGFPINHDQTILPVYRSAGPVHIATIVEEVQVDSPQSSTDTVHFQTSTNSSTCAKPLVTRSLFAISEEYVTGWDLYILGTYLATAMRVFPTFLTTVYVFLQHTQGL
jgi:hypothetical protein